MRIMMLTHSKYPFYLFDPWFHASILLIAIWSRSFIKLKSYNKTRPWQITSSVHQVKKTTTWKRDLPHFAIHHRQYQGSNSLRIHKDPHPEKPVRRKTGKYLIPKKAWRTEKWWVLYIWVSSSILPDQRFWTAQSWIITPQEQKNNSFLLGFQNEFLGLQ